MLNQRKYELWELKWRAKGQAGGGEQCFQVSHRWPQDRSRRAQDRDHLSQINNDKIKDEKFHVNKLEANRTPPSPQPPCTLINVLNPSTNPPALPSTPILSTSPPPTSLALLHHHQRSRQSQHPPSHHHRRRPLRPILPLQPLSLRQYRRGASKE